VFRTSDIVLIAVMVSAAALTYKTKRDAEEQLAAVQKIHAQIRYEEDTIDLLKADWSLLTQPSRLQKLTVLYKAQLQLEPVTAHQIVGVGDLPAKALDIDDILAGRQGGMADNSGDAPLTGKKTPAGKTASAGKTALDGRDPVVTGGIAQ
jgi:cell division protein FtsL